MRALSRIFIPGPFPPRPLTAQGGFLLEEQGHVSGTGTSADAFTLVFKPPSWDGPQNSKEIFDVLAKDEYENQPKKSKAAYFYARGPIMGQAPFTVFFQPVPKLLKSLTRS